MPARSARFASCVVARLASSAAALLLAASPATGATLLGTDTPFTGAIPAIESTQAVAQAFTLTSSVSVSSIDLGLGNGPNVAPIALQLTDSLGPGTTALDVLFTASIPGSTVPTFTALVNVPASLTLGPGTYYLVVSLPGSPLYDYTWSTAYNVLPSSVGTVGQGLYCCFPNPVGVFPPAETFKPLTPPGPGDPTQLYFDLQGAAVPEPSLAALLTGGLGLVIALRKRS
jgi:hypothetical protein